jgi:hypothetical protein
MQKIPSLLGSRRGYGVRVHDIVYCGQEKSIIEQTAADVAITQNTHKMIIFVAYKQDTTTVLCHPLQSIAKSLR